MQIGDLSRQTGVNIETIRYYERIGVLPKPARQPNGRRTYSPADAERLGFIRHARELGFDLPSIRILLALQERPEASCEDASRIAQEQLEAVESRIARLLLLQDELARMVSECRRGRVSECRVIEALAPALIRAGGRGLLHPSPKQRQANLSAEDALKEAARFLGPLVFQERLLTLGQCAPMVGIGFGLAQHLAQQLDFSF